MENGPTEEGRRSESSASTVHEIDNDEDDFVNSPEWRSKSMHVFILSEAGKPIYSRFVQWHI